MPRPLWKGTVSFGLVSVPVELWSAVRDQNVRFREIHVEDGSPVKHVRYCKAEDKPVDPSEVGRAYEVDDRMIRITDEELDSLAPEKTQTIEIESFTPRKEVDPVRFDHPYYLIPGNSSVGTIRAYRLLVEAMSEGDLLALGKFVMRSREQLAAIRVRNETLALSTMHFPAEIRDIENTPGPEEAAEREAVADAVAVIEERSVEWDPSSYEDRHRERLLGIIESKRKGKKIKKPKPAREDQPTAAPDLMAALKKTLEESKGRRRRPKDLGGKTRQELYELASKRGLKGRSSMTKKELRKALES